MHHIIGLRRALTCIYRSSWILYLALNIACENGSCADDQIKKPPVSGHQVLLGGQVPLEKNNTPRQGKKRKGRDVQDLNEVADALETPIKTLKRVAKVREDQQAIVLLHGLARISDDFKAMIAALKLKFPHALVVALKSVDKDSTKDKSSSPSSKLSIKEQATLAYEEIRTRIGRDKHVVLVGHSQGGLRAFTLVKEYKSRLESEYGIVIDRLITIGTPWKGATLFKHIKDVVSFNEKFDKIALILDAIREGYSSAVRGYFFKKAPELAKKHPSWYRRFASVAMTLKNPEGVKNLDPESDFIRRYVALGLKCINVPITAIAGVLTDFSQLFEAFPSSIGREYLGKLNLTYAELIGGYPTCEHDMLLPVDTQHAEGLVTKDFERIKVYGACHGNKVGVKVKEGLSELNNPKVIEQVVAVIEKTFYKQESVAPSAA